MCCVCLQLCCTQDDPGHNAIGHEDRNSFVYVPVEMLMYESGTALSTSTNYGSDSVDRGYNYSTTNSSSHGSPHGGAAKTNDLSSTGVAGQQQIMHEIRASRNTPTESDSAVRRDQEKLLRKIQGNSSSGVSGAMPNGQPVGALENYPGTTRSYHREQKHPAYGSSEPYTVYRRKKAAWESLGLESLVELPATDGSQLHGVIRWLSKPVTVGELEYPPTAGIELVSSLLCGGPYVYRIFHGCGLDASHGGLPTSLHH